MSHTYEYRDYSHDHHPQQQLGLHHFYVPGIGYMIGPWHMNLLKVSEFINLDIENFILLFLWIITMNKKIKQ
jgi:hypothetical protein